MENNACNFTHAKYIFGLFNYNISFYEEQNHAILCNAAKLYSKVFNLVKALKGRLYGGFNLKCGI